MQCASQYRSVIEFKFLLFKQKKTNERSGGKKESKPKKERTEKKEAAQIQETSYSSQNRQEKLISNTS